jgi:hypothetical protein
MVDLERAFGRMIVGAQEHGAFIACQAIAELLYQAGMNEAAEMVSDHGETVVARAFSEAAWSQESQPAGVAAASPATNTSK